MDRMEHVRALRANTEVHYNCCQSVLVPFAKEMGMTEQQAFALGSHFGSGMRHGSACGAFTGALMVLGTQGYDNQIATELIRQFREAHGSTSCADLLKASHDNGIARKPHCDGLVFEMVDTLERILASQS